MEVWKSHSAWSRLGASGRLIRLAPHYRLYIALRPRRGSCILLVKGMAVFLDPVQVFRCFALVCTISRSTRRWIKLENCISLAIRFLPPHTSAPPAFPASSCFTLSEETTQGSKGICTRLTTRIKSLLEYMPSVGCCLDDLSQTNAYHFEITAWLTGKHQGAPATRQPLKDGRRAEFRLHTICTPSQAPSQLTLPRCRTL